MVLDNRVAVAAGDWVCRVLHPASPETQTVFLDELAEAMAGSGKAEVVTVAEAVEIISAVSSPYLSPRWLAANISNATRPGRGTAFSARLSEPGSIGSVCLGTL
ncbi:MAG TPA: hypothetical protein DEB17_09505 [Chlorobaculum sp.]|uniref:Uncharacterized protein n=1 Tax=Chlorobaculum tepidum (strain ATCC 49652 / DSM 12025 / NBRC 103806 / TLS) TaxID=194439 RepID=Q8KBE5_CHLTE|nr:hypothetical protein CT1843 [Chlorobaculum tepidum TLS]HBU24204.1 hypothetical protein [Chlorobaculum sp.]